MIRFALVCTFVTFVGYTTLPGLRAEFTAPLFQACLRNTPRVHFENEIQSLVCGSSLQNPASTGIVACDAAGIVQAWRNLGLIHILVVSGGHLTILGAVISAIVSIIVNLFRRIFPENRRQAVFLRRASTLVVGLVLIGFSLANRLQPPVLRALLEWFGRRPLEQRGWRSPEVALISTWLALPFCSSIYDLLSLALSFFATVTVEQTARSLHRHKWLAAFALQTAVWWILLPLLFTMGVPHPLTSMLNLALAPLLGATLIPFAMLTWLSGSFPVFFVRDDPVGLGYAFDWCWEKLSLCMRLLADFMPAASSRLPGQKPLLFGAESTTALLFATSLAIAALLIRSRRERRRESIENSPAISVCIVFVGFVLALIVHRQLG